jgi:hypothetical protein
VEVARKKSKKCGGFGMSVRKEEPLEKGGVGQNIHKPPASSKPSQVGPGAKKK